MRNYFVIKTESRSFQRFLAILALSILFTVPNTFAGDSTGVADKAYPTDPASIEAGKALFMGKCKSCHNPVFAQQNPTYPSLEGVIDRAGGASSEQARVDWLREWIPNAGKMIGTDKYAKDLFKQYGVAMTTFSDLTPEQVDQLIAYIGSGGETPVEKSDITVPGQPASSDDSTTMMVLGIVLVALILIIGVLVLLATHLQKSLNDKEGLNAEDKKVVNQKHDIVKVLKHPAFYGTVIALLLAAGLVAFIQKGVYGIGVQTGYAPVQPIPFSHKIHAGDNKIDCNYCHTGVRKSKHANIPSPNICMNCHTTVKTDSKWIQELHSYVDYDTKTKTYGPNQKPIQWTRVHNLPDLAYFNHSQHVKVAGLECQQCHGPVQEMETMYQYSTLTMGWCIDCHRNTPINLDAYDNESGYYNRELAEKLLEFRKKENSEFAMEKAKEAMDGGAPFHETLEGLKYPLTVEDIGGMECSKCHY